jgi:hypothetical protein
MNKEKKILFISAGIVALLFAAVFMLLALVNNAQQRLVLMESVYAEMANDKTALISMAEVTKALKARAGESRNRNVVTEMERTAAEFGLSKNLKKINFITRRQDGNVSADDYELQFEGVDINTAVNFIYRISNTGILVKIRKCSMTVSFENPAMLNISLLISHLK